MTSDFTNGKGKSTSDKHYDAHGSGYKDASQYAKTENHYKRHNKDFNYKSADEYKKAASNFLEKKPTKTTQTFVSKEGTYFRYDTTTNEFGIINKYGGVSTYFKPEEGMAYWLKQIELYGK